MSGLHEKLEKVRQSSDAKTVASNFAWLTLLQIAGYIFPLITLPYLAGVIGVDGFGKVSFALSVILFAQTFVDWGFNYTATRDVARNRDDKKLVSEIFSNVLWSRCLLMLMALAVVMILTLVIPGFRENRAVILVTFLMIPGHIMYPDWFFQAMERMKYTTILNVLSRLLFTIAVFIFVKDADDFILQPLLTSAGFVVSGLIAMYIIRSWGVTLNKPSFKGISGTIKSSTDVFINNLMPNLYNSFSNILLGIFGGSYQTGLFDAGYKFVNVAQQFLGIFSRAFFPFLSRKIDKHSLFTRLNLSASILGTILLLLFAPLIIRLFYTEEFEYSVHLLRVLALSLPFISLSNIYGTNYLIITGHERELRRITVVMSIIGFLLSFPLIYYWGCMGAAVNIALTRALLGSAMAIKAMVLKRNDNEDRDNQGN